MEDKRKVKTIEVKRMVAMYEFIWWVSLSLPLSLTSRVEEEQRILVHSLEQRSALLWTIVDNSPICISSSNGSKRGTHETRLLSPPRGELLIDLDLGQLPTTCHDMILEKGEEVAKGYSITEVGFFHPGQLRVILDGLRGEGGRGGGDGR